MSRPTGPVIVSLHVEAFGEGRDDTFEIPRDKWDAMTPAERAQLLETEATDFAANYVGWGWHIDDPDDYAAAVGQTSA